MGASFALILILAQAAPAQPSAPPVIIQVKSKSTVCAAIKDQIGPVVSALLQNDHVIVHGVVSMQQMFGDVGRPWMQIDKLHLENDVSKIVRNLQATSDLLNRPDPAGTGPADAAAIAAMKSQLRKVAGEQLATLNTLDGTLETQQMNQLMGSNDVPNIAGSDTVNSNAAAYGAESVNPKDVAVSEQISMRTPSNVADAPIVRYARASFPALRLAEAQAAEAIVPVATSCDRLVAPPKIGP